ncbi:unnamed protein product [Discula destructiva]
MAGGSPSSSSSPSAGASSQASYFAARTRVNQQQMRYFAAGVCGLIAVFILAHWLRVLFNKLSTSPKNPLRTVSRFVRNLLVRSFPGLPSTGHALVVAAYLAMNLALTFTNVTIKASSIANRCGWLVVANFCVVVFLALKNTPLAVLTAYSYERLNVLHQISGYLTFVYLVLHASMYTHYFISDGRTATLEEGSVVSGIVAGFAFLGLFLSGAIIRQWWYEAFLAMHILFFVVGLITSAFHQPDLAKNGLLIMMAVVAGMWGADRVVRGGRMLINSFGNYAVVEPLPHGGTKIVLSKGPFGGAVAGMHCFVWIPSIRIFESHPFTIAATEPMEFVVNAYDGFTRDLHKYAALNPGARLRVSVDGPYGTIPDPLKFDKVVLIAGGSGATFTFGLASNMLERMGPQATNNIVFIWSVKKHANLSWFADHLQTLKAHPHSPNVTTSLHVSESSALSNANTADSSDTEDSDPNRHGNNNNNNNSSSSEKAHAGDTTASFATAQDPEKHHPVRFGHNHRHQQQRQQPRPRTSDDSYHHHGHPVKPGRPDAAALIREAVASTPTTGRVLVAACGPDGLLRTVRDVTAGLIRGDGPSVELHCEKFGW